MALRTTEAGAELHPVLGLDAVGIERQQDDVPEDRALGVDLRGDHHIRVGGQGGNTKRQGDGQGFQSHVHQTTLLDSPVNPVFRI